MLTRLFSHSKPIAYAILSLVFIIAFVIENFFSANIDVTVGVISSKMGFLLVFLLILFLLHFIVRRNKIHLQHTYAISTFTLLIIAFPEILRTGEFIIGYLFLLLALRRMLRLKTNTQVKQKILDSSLLLSISILFVPMHWLFILVIYFGVILYASQNYRHFIIPLVGIAVGFVLHMCFFLIMKGEWVHYSFYLPEFNGIQDIFYDFKYNILLGGLLMIVLWVFFQLPSIYSKAKLHESESLSVILVFLFLAILVVILNDLPISKDAIYIIWPLSILVGNYLQLKSTKKWIKEVLYLAFMSSIIFSAIYS